MLRVFSASTGPEPSAGGGRVGSQAIFHPVSKAGVYLLAEADGPGADGAELARVFARSVGGAAPVLRRAAVRAISGDKDRRALKSVVVEVVRMGIEHMEAAVEPAADGRTPTVSFNLLIFAVGHAVCVQQGRTQGVLVREGRLHLMGRRRASEPPEPHPEHPVPAPEIIVARLEEGDRIVLVSGGLAQRVAMPPLGNLCRTVTDGASLARDLVREAARSRQHPATAVVAEVLDPAAAETEASLRQLGPVDPAEVEDDHDDEPGFDGPVEVTHAGRMDPLSGLVAHFRDAPLFESLDDRQILVLLTRMTPRPLEKGEILFQRGGPAEALYLVHMGRIRLEGTMNAHMVVEPHNIIGERALLADEPHAFTARALNAGHVLVLWAEDLHETIEAFPRLGLRLYQSLSRLLAQRLRVATERAPRRGEGHS